ncbi:MAG: hypothetical protein ACPGDA_01720 [Paracoccaceae bacterium]
MGLHYTIVISFPRAGAFCPLQAAQDFATFLRWASGIGLWGLWR